MIPSLKKSFGSLIENVTENIGLSKIQKMLNSQFSDTLDNVLQDRKNDSANSNFSLNDKEDIIKGYLIKNVSLATATSFVPGPAGMLAGIPGIITSMANKMKCTYDIACVYGKEDLLVKDLLIDVPLQSMGVPAGLASKQNLDKIQELDQKAITEKIKALTLSLAKKKIKGSLGGFIPGMSTVFAIAQAKMEMAKTAETASSFFDPEAVIMDPILDPTLAIGDIQSEKIKALVNLLTLDSKATPEEIHFITPIIENSELSNEEKENYKNALGTSATDYTVNYSMLLNSGMTEDLIVDLAVLTKRDGEIGPRELEYVKFVADQLVINESIFNQVLYDA